MFSRVPTARCYAATAMTGCALLAVPHAVSFAQTSAQNLALNRPATFNVAPNYALCTDTEDALQLTDGKRSSEANLREVQGTQAIWVQKGTVGWNMRSPVVITIDLGRIQPISGISFSTAAGQSEVHWPSAILFGVSDDNKQWNAQGDLVELSAKNGEPPKSGYSTHRYATNALQTRGRYISFAVENKPYLFVDEIEVFRGDDAWLRHHAGGTPVEGMENLALSVRVRDAVRRRLQQDAQSVQKAITDSKLPEARRTGLLRELQKASSEIEAVPAPDVTTFRTTFPQNDVHARIWSIHGAMLGARLPALTAWKQHRFAWLTPTSAPVQAPAKAPALEIQMLGNEWRADSFVLSNATEKVVTAKLRIAGMPGGPEPAWLKVSQAAWTDTFKNEPVASALVDAPFRNGAFELKLPAGLPAKIWLTVDSSKLPARSHRGQVIVSAPGGTVRLPLTVRVSPVKMPRPRLALGMWDYTDGSGIYGTNPGNIAAAIKLMQSHFVDTPWATGSALPRPSAADFDANNNLQTPLDFARFDEWVKRWPKARRYFVFANVQREFAGAAMGTPQFQARVGSWAKALSAHMKKLGLQPQHLGLLLVDEPETEEEDERVVAWAHAIKATTTEITLFQDPVWHRPDQTKNQEAITLADIVCPDLTLMEMGKEPVKKYFQDRRAAGQSLWVYQCSGPTRTYSPTRYFRQQSWHAFHYGATGMGFWSFGDLGGAKSSWNEYLAAWNSYVPAFLSETDATDSIHWQAVREGVEDYEYFALLRDAAGHTKNRELRKRADALLASLPLTTPPTQGSEGTYAAYHWSQAEDAQAADAYRLQVLALLEDIHKS